MSNSFLAGAFSPMIYLFWAMAALCIVFVPLGVWKAVEIAIWIIHHIHWAA